MRWLGPRISHERMGRVAVKALARLRRYPLTSAGIQAWRSARRASRRTRSGWARRRRACEPGTRAAAGPCCCRSPARARSNRRGRGRHAGQVRRPAPAPTTHAVGRPADGVATRPRKGCVEVAIRPDRRLRRRPSTAGTDGCRVGFRPAAGHPRANGSCCGRLRSGRTAIPWAPVATGSCRADCRVGVDQRDGVGALLDAIAEPVRPGVDGDPAHGMAGDSGALVRAKRRGEHRVEVSGRWSRL